MFMTDEERRQKQLECLKQLRPIDDTLMRCLFKNRPRLVKLVLRIFTGKPDLEVLHSNTQYDMKRLAGAKSVVLDV